MLAQDGAKCHTAHSTIHAIRAEAGDILDWPPMSPDLNPIENVWAVLKTAVYGRNPANEEELRQAIIEEWQNLDNNIVALTAQTISARIRKLRRLGGLYVGH